jgi:PAS domain S-box-containing protein
MIRSLLLSSTGALQDSDLLWRMFDESPVRMALLTPDGRFFQANQALSTTLGYSREELRKLTLADIGYPDAKEEQEAEVGFRALMEGRAPRWEMDRRAVHKSGELLWLHLLAQPLRSETGRPAHALVVIRDASGRKRAEISLKQNEERFRQIADNSKDVFWVLELRTGQTMFVNPAFKDVWGFWPEGGKLTYDEWRATIHPEDREHVARALKKECDGELEHDIEYRIVRPDGSVRHIQDRGAVIRDIHRRAYRLAGVAVDITNRVVMDRLKDEFISMISHELRTPLTSLHGSLRLIEGGLGGPIPEEMRSLFQIAKESSERLVRLVSDLLDIEKIERGGLEMRMQPTDLVALSGHVIDSMRALGSERGIELIATYEVERAEVMADPDRLTQVLTHLLSNATKFSPEGAPVELTLSRSGDCYRVHVIDYGAGIPPEVADRIFEKFVQGDSSSTRSYGGTGLGLTISKAIVERHGGQIGFESEPGKGTVFYFDIPAAA